MNAIDRLPPHSNESEQAVLGCILIDPNEALPVAIARIGQDLDVFYDARHKEIYRITVEMYDAQQPIDLVTLHEWLMFQELLESVGGDSYLSSLPETVPSAANLPAYLDTVLDHYRSRKLIQICSQAVTAVYDHEDETNNLVDKASQSIFELAAGSVAEEETPIQQLVHGALNTIEEVNQSQGIITGIETGFVDFDRMTTGLQAGEMYVVAARPSMGKTSFAMNVAEHVSVNLHLPVGVFSLEMTKESLVMRMLCSLARVNLRNVRDGFLAERDFPKITGAAGKLVHAPIFINDTSGLSILGLRTRARRMHRQHGIRLLIVDYLQLMHAERGRRDSREQEVAAISAGIKGLAKELRIPVIAVSQLNRGIEQQEHRRKPRLSDLRESGAIEQDADLVALLYHPQEEDNNTDYSASVNLYIAKQRNGPTGDVPLVFLKMFTRFESAAKVSAEDVPGESQQQQLV